MPRQAIYDQATLDALLRAAGRILADEGAAALTMRRLASEVSATTSAIYALFGSKQELLRAMYRQGFEGLGLRLAEVDQGDPVQRVRALAFAYRRAAIERPHLYQVMFSCPVPDFTPNQEDTDIATATLLTLRDAIAAALHAGAFHGDPSDGDPSDGDASDGDVDTITTGLWAAVHGLTSLELAGSLGDAASADSVWDTMIAAILAGLAGSASNAVTAILGTDP